MRRRNFVNNSILGLMGTHVSNSVFTPFFRSTPDVVQWFHRFLRLTSLYSFAWRSADDPVLDSGMKDLLRPLQKMGYDLFHHPVYYANGKYCMIPCKMQHQALTEINLLFFAKKSDATWQLVTQWNGFELESIVHAGEILKTNQESLSDLLLPVKSWTKGHVYPEKFITKAGKVHIKIDLSGCKAQTSITIEKDGVSILHRQFESGHCLTSNVSLIS